MKHLEDLSAGFGGADCYFTVSRDIGRQVKELAAASSMKLEKIVNEDADGAIAVHAKSLALLLGQPVAPAPTPVVPHSPPIAETTEPGSATSDDSAAI